MSCCKIRIFRFLDNYSLKNAMKKKSRYRNVHRSRGRKKKSVINCRYVITLKCDSFDLALSKNNNAGGKQETKDRDKCRNTSFKEFNSK